MDVHPTKMVLIGIDPYPYHKWQFYLDINITSNMKMDRRLGAATSWSLPLECSHLHLAANETWHRGAADMEISKKWFNPVTRPGKRTKSYGKWPIEIDGLPLKNGDVHWFSIVFCMFTRGYSQFTPVTLWEILRLRHCFDIQSWCHGASIFFLDDVMM